MGTIAASPPASRLSTDSAYGWAPKIGNYLDQEEQALFESVEGGDAPFTSVLTSARRQEIEDVARATINDDRSKISLRVPKGDLIRLKSRALQEGIPYQTLINALIHKYVSR